jgi:omega-6 fatty acid desaturase (delta-12 desaturase)
MTATMSSRDGSLAPVRAAIPASCFQRSTARGLVSIAVDLAVWVAVLALLARADVWWQVLGLEVLAAFAVAGLFILGHDAAHRALLDDDKLNGIAARVLMLPSLHVNEAWVLGHNRVHHGFTARQGMDFVWHPVTAEEYSALPTWKRLRHRLEWSAIGSGAYYLREVWWNKMITFRPPANKAKAIRRDLWLIAGWAAAFSAFTMWLGWSSGGTVGAALWMWVKLLVVPFYGFIHVIGWAVYVHHVGPDIPWWTRDEWTRLRAQTESTTILRAPWVLNLVFHNIFIHVPHHVDTRIPWYHLPEAAAAIEAAMPDAIVDEPMRIGSYLSAAKQCKLYDFTTKQWSSYPRHTAAAGTAG